MAINLLNNGYFAGSVGIGIANPQKPLDVSGNAKILGTLTVETANNNIRLLDLNDSTINFSVGVNGKFQIRDVDGGTNPFQIEKAAISDSLYIKADGNVGIGTNNPDRKLHVKDVNIVVSEFEGTNTGSLMDLVNSNSSQLYNGIRFTQGTTSKMAITHIADGTTKGYIQIGNSWATGSEILVVDGRTSNVGIGTTSPKQQLHVSGGTTAGDVTKMVIGATGGNAESYLYLAELFSGDNVNYGFAFVADGNSSNNLLFKRHSNSTSGTTVMEIRRDSDQIRFNGYSGTNQTGTPTYILGTTSGGDIVKVLGADIPGLTNYVTLTTTQTISGEKTFTKAVHIDTAGGSESMDLYNENNTAPIADSFSGNTSKSYIYFNTVAGSNDAGFIMHESSATETNEGVLHLCPSDDNQFGDYISIHGSNDPDVLNLHTSGLIETVNLQLQIKSGSGNVYLNDSVDIANNLLVSGTATITSDLTVNGGDITLGGTGRIQGIDTVSASTDAANKAYVDAGDARVAPAAPSTVTSTIVGETIEIAFNQSATSNIDYYQVWSSDDGGDYGIIGQIAPADFSSTMTVVDTTFVTGGTMSYRVYAVKTGIYSSAATTSKSYTVSALSVTAMTVVNLNTAYYIQYEKPVSRFIDHIEIYMDSQATSAALNRSNASIVYSGQNASYMRNVGTSNNFHQFWVEVVTT